MLTFFSRKLATEKESEAALREVQNTILDTAIAIGIFGLRGSFLKREQFLLVEVELVEAEDDGQAGRERLDEVDDGRRREPVRVAVKRREHVRVVESIAHGHGENVAVRDGNDELR